MSKTHKKIILADHIVVESEDRERGDVATLLNNDANLLLAMGKAYLADSDEGKDLAKTVRAEKAKAAE